MHSSNWYGALIYFNRKTGVSVDVVTIEAPTLFLGWPPLPPEKAAIAEEAIETWLAGNKDRMRWNADEEQFEPSSADGYVGTEEIRKTLVRAFAGGLGIGNNAAEQ